MIAYYQRKMVFHFNQWELSVDASKSKSADFHMAEYLNYKEMLDIRNKTN